MMLVTEGNIETIHTGCIYANERLIKSERKTQVINTILHQSMFHLYMLFKQVHFDLEKHGYILRMRIQKNLFKIEFGHFHHNNFDWS